MDNLVQKSKVSPFPGWGKVAAIDGDTVTLEGGLQAVKCCDCRVNDIVALESVRGTLRAIAIKGGLGDHDYLSLDGGTVNGTVNVVNDFYVSGKAGKMNLWVNDEIEGGGKGLFSYNSDGQYAEIIKVNQSNRINGLGEIQTNPVLYGGSEPKFIFKSEGVDSTASTSAVNYYRDFAFLDKNDRWTGWLENTQSTTGTIQTEIGARNASTGSNIDNILRLGVYADGNRYVSVSDASAWRSAIGAFATNGGTLTGSVDIKPVSNMPKLYLTIPTANIAQNGSNPTSTAYGGIYYNDKTGYMMGFEQCDQSVNGVVRTILGVKTRRSGTEVLNYIGLVENTAGTGSVEISHPAAWRTALGLGDAATVIASGVSGNWYYIKFGDGTAISYKPFDVVQSTMNTAWGSFYVSSDHAQETLPFTYSAVPATQVFIRSSDSGGHSVWPVIHSNTTTTKSASYFLARATSVSASRKYYTSIVVIGRWK